jgi:hypothetical protein
MAEPDLENLWARLLSREPETIRAAWELLQGEERTAIYTHLVIMATEEGWSEPQRLSAQAALDVIQDGWDGSKKP